MLTTDPIYYKPLLPQIFINNTANNTVQYQFSSFTGAATGTGLTNVFPLFCSVNLSKDTQGQFVIQFEDQSKVMEPVVTVGSRVIIKCGKQSSATTSLISGLVRKKGYSRGANNKALYTISGSSTAIRLNELLRYVVSEARKTADGITPDKTDVSRKADTLLAANLTRLTADGILSIANLAANSDVETFIASLSIEYGQLQDIVTYIEQQSGGQVVVDTNDLVNFRYEIKNNLTGRGFTIKNQNTNQANDDADDTMYLIDKNWSYEDDFYTSSNYSNKLTAIMRADPRPSAPVDLGFVEQNAFTCTFTQEYAVKFRPTHTRITPGDLYIVAGHWNEGGVNTIPMEYPVLICKDSGTGVPLNTNGVVGSYGYFRTNFQTPLPTAYAIGVTNLINDGFCYNSSLVAPGDLYLDTTKDYWLIFTRTDGANDRVTIGRNMYATLTPNLLTHTSNFATIFNGGTGWVPASSGDLFLPCFGIGRYRSTPYTIWDPKAMQYVQSGLSQGQAIEAMVTETAVQITTRDSMIRHLASQLYNKTRPSTLYNFPSVLAPNIPPFPGDPIIVSDSVLGLSTAGNQIALTTCGDMTYQWGNMGTGSYDAPTKLSIQAVATHPRYR
jgi:hypothetical protein